MCLSVRIRFILSHVISGSLIKDDNLIAAATRGDMEQVEVYLQEGVDVDYRLDVRFDSQSH